MRGILLMDNQVLGFYMNLPKKWEFCWALGRGSLASEHYEEHSNVNLFIKFKSTSETEALVIFLNDSSIQPMTSILDTLQEQTIQGIYLDTIWVSMGVKSSKTRQRST